jgi:UDP-N-acetyl-D-mannosaminuronic acid transferase (WecB/TagA/CpsF family)
MMAPAAPALKDIPVHADYREALLGADLVIADSAFMVLAWNLLEQDSIQRVSGLAFLRAALARDEVRRPGNTLWVMASQQSARRNLEWLRSQGITVPKECIYLAPLYGDRVEDPELIRRIESAHFQHVIVTIGGGTQERLGLYLKSHLSYRPGIYCIGAAIAFLSGDQVFIPEWADRLYLGWLLRSLSSPRRYVPRYWSAWLLLPLLWRFRDQLPTQVSELSQSP